MASIGGGLGAHNVQSAHVTSYTEKRPNLPGEKDPSAKVERPWDRDDINHKGKQFKVTEYAPPIHIVTREEGLHREIDNLNKNYVDPPMPPKAKAGTRSGPTCELGGPDHIVFDKPRLKTPPRTKLIVRSDQELKQFIKVDERKDNTALSMQSGPSMIEKMHLAHLGDQHPPNDCLGPQSGSSKKILQLDVHANAQWRAKEHSPPGAPMVGDNYEPAGLKGVGSQCLPPARGGGRKAYVDPPPPPWDGADKPRNRKVIGPEQKKRKATL